LTDKEFQIMRDQSFAVIRAVGVETGGSNIQFGVSPENGRMGHHRDETPRVSPQFLPSQARPTGFSPSRKIAAKPRRRLTCLTNSRTTSRAKNPGELRAEH